MENEHLSAIIAHLYPDAVSRVDFELAYDPTDSRGVYISRWDSGKLGPRPSPSRIESARLPALRNVKSRQMALRARDQMDRIFPAGPWEREAIRRGRPNEARLSGADWIERNLLTKLNEIDAARTEQELQNITWG